eukprot:gene9236-10941_t
MVRGCAEGLVTYTDVPGGACALFRDNVTFTGLGPLWPEVAERTPEWYHAFYVDGARYTGYFARSNSSGLTGTPVPFEDDEDWSESKSRDWFLFCTGGVFSRFWEARFHHLGWLWVRSIASYIAQVLASCGLYGLLDKTGSASDFKKGR